jgi:hypothetical protein
MHPFLRRVATTMLVVFAAASRLPAAQIVYNFSSVASSATFSGLSAPAINNSGKVAFLANGAAYTVAPHGAPVAAISNASLTGAGAISYSPSINDAGIVAATVGGYINFGGSVLSSTGGGTTVASTPAPVGGSSFGLYGANPAIRADGTIGFEFNHQAGFGGEGFFTGSGGPIATLYSDQTGGSMIDPGASRSANVIAYAAPILSGTLDTGTAFFVNNGSSTSQAATSSRFFNSVAVNAGGTVAASSSGLASPDGGIYETQGGSLITLVAGTETVNSFGDVSINDSGMLAFYESTTNTSGAVSGIYLLSGGTVSKIIAIGDPLAGSTVTGLSFGDEALNNNGQVAFLATLGNGTSGEFSGSPVPEPSSLVLAAVAAVFVIATRLLSRRGITRPV